jgi:hypothetical protein
VRSLFFSAAARPGACLSTDLPEHRSNAADGLDNSYHLATLDYDQDIVFDQTLKFIRLQER